MAGNSNIFFTPPAGVGNIYFFVDHGDNHIEAVVGEHNFFFNQHCRRRKDILITTQLYFL